MQAIEATARRLDPLVRVRVTPLSENLDRVLWESGFAAYIAATLGAVALMLASVGVFGVFAYFVQRGAREIGIRMALGATAGEVIRVVLGSNARPLVVGLAVGLLGAVAGSGLMAASLYGLSPGDPLTYAGVLCVMALAALVAVYVPARRATRIDPINALRRE